MGGLQRPEGFTRSVVWVQVPVLEELEQALGSPLDKKSQAPAVKPLVIVISGPSGVGKDAVIKVRKNVWIMLWC